MAAHLIMCVCVDSCETDDEHRIHTNRRLAHKKPSQPSMARTHTHARAHTQTIQFISSLY